MTWEIAFALADERVVQVPVTEVLEVQDDIAGRCCIVITLRERYRVPLPRSKVLEAMELLQ